MTKIAINDLSPAGTDLFMDSESFLNELTDEQLNETQGGSILSVAAIISTVGCMVVAGGAFVIGVTVGYHTRRK